MDSASLVAAYFESKNGHLEYAAIEDPDERAVFVKVLFRRMRECVASLQEMADPGDPEVWHALGDAFETGWGIRKDSIEAMIWFMRAAGAGHTKSMVRLGRVYQNEGTTEDDQRAIARFRQAAELGNTEGMISLGFAYRDGRGVDADPREAANWFIKAVESGDGHSMIHLGRVYARFLDDADTALTWFLKAKEAGFTESHVELAMIFDTEGSALYNPSEAVRWWHVVAEESDGRGSFGRAAIALAKHYRSGRGVQYDLSLARTWLDRVIEKCGTKSSFYREAVKLLAKMEGDFI